MSQETAETASPESETRRIRHEINNALAGIIGHAQLIRLRGEIDPKTRERVGKIEDIANKLRDIAEQLKD
jgi:signal transduction histidine kinase